MKEKTNKGKGEALPAMNERISKVLAYQWVAPGSSGWYELLNCGAAAAEECRNGNIPVANWVVMKFAQAAGTTQMNVWQKIRKALAAAKWDITVSEVITYLGGVGILFR